MVTAREQSTRRVPGARSPLRTGKSFTLGVLEATLLPLSYVWAKICAPFPADSSSHNRPHPGHPSPAPRPHLTGQRAWSDGAGAGQVRRGQQEPDSHSRGEGLRRRREETDKDTVLLHCPRHSVPLFSNVTDTETVACSAISFQFHHQFFLFATFYGRGRAEKVF